MSETGGVRAEPTASAVDAAVAADSGVIVPPGVLSVEDDRDDRGPILMPSIARPKMVTRACSFRHPACVHGDPAEPAVILTALASVDAAWDVLTGSLGLPAPDADPESLAYNLYLVESVPDGDTGRTVWSARDPRSRVDRASAFSVVDRRLQGCTRDVAITREVARAALYRSAPATDEGTARAETAYLTRLAVPCALGRIDGIADFQANPERAIADTWSERDPRVGAAYNRGAALFDWWLDASFGAQPGAIVRARWALTPTMTPFGAWRWQNEPDAYDVFRVTFAGALTTGSTIDDLWVDFAAARALLGRADDGTVLPEARALGDVLTPRLDWDIDWPSSPRRLASRFAVFPTGASYVAIRHSGAAPGARLRIEAEWEEHASMRWLVVKRDAAGHSRGRVLVPSVPRATSAQLTVVDLDAVESLLVIGVNVGDPSFTFDPDDAVWEPHGWLLTVASE